MKRKLLALAALAVILSVTAVACGDKDDKKPADTSAPAVTTATPDETTAPADETTAPADETTAPADETTAPADETTAPADETTAPEEETTTPSSPDDYSLPFTSNVSSNPDGTDLQQSDLFMLFNFSYGIGDPHCVSNGKYALGGVNEMYADVDGFYAYSIVMDRVVSHNTANSFAFCRGAQDITFYGLTEDMVTDTVRPIGNYFEDDGSSAPGSMMMGGAGIYATITEGKLMLAIKYHDPSAQKGVANKYYTLSVDSNKLTLADDGKTVYVLAGDTLCATIELSGSKDYDAISAIPAISFAETATVTLADGTVDVIENTLVAATHLAQVGIASRAGVTEFSSLSIAGFSTIEIPEMVVDSLQVDKSTVVEGQPIYVFANGSSTDYIGIYAEGSDTLLNKVYLTGDKRIDLNAGLDTPLAAGTYTIRFMPNDATDVSAATAVETIKIVAVSDMIYNIGDTGAMVVGSCFDGTHSNADGHVANLKADAITLPAGTTELKMWGWAGFKCETFAFGYIIDDNAPVIKDEFTHVFDETDENGMADKNAIAEVVASMGGVASGRHDIRVDLTGLAAGTYTIRAVAQQEDGAKVVLQQFTITIV